MKRQEMAINLDAGIKTIAVNFGFGEPDQIQFNPSDPKFTVRLKQMMKNLDEYSKQVKDIELDEEGQPIEHSFLEKFEEMRKKMEDEIDKAFNSSISAVVFKHCSPFAKVKGQYFVTQFLNAILPVIKADIEKTQKESTERKRKHLDKYI